MYLTNLRLKQPEAMDLIESGVIGAARTLIAESLCDIERSMEETFINFAKGSGTFVSPILVMIYFH